jgi:hypothetical protein
MNSSNMKRYSASIKRSIKLLEQLQTLLDALDTVKGFDATSASSESKDALLDSLVTKHKATFVVESVLDCDLSGFREELERRALSECGYDLRNGTHVNENGEPIRD